MVLSEWLQVTGTARSDFAAQIGVSKMSLSRYVRGLQIPEKEVMGRIVRVTNGGVTPNDFYSDVIESERAAS